MRKMPMTVAVIAFVLGCNDLYGSEDYDLQEQTKWCIGSVPWEEGSIKRGFFINPQEQTEVCIVPRPAMEAKTIQHEDGPRFTLCADSFYKDEDAGACLLCDHETCEGERPYRDSVTGVESSSGYESFGTSTCRDPVSGRDHLILDWGSGGTTGSTYYHFFSFDPETRTLRLEYIERETYFHDESEQLALEGACNWRERQMARKTVNDALAAFRVRIEGDDPDAPFQIADTSTRQRWPTRLIPGEVARKWLLALAETQRNFTTLEGATYAADSDRAAWRVIQVLDEGQEDCSAPGVALVQDRRKKEWRTIYHVPTGCKALRFPMKSMVVKDDSLFAWVCTGCYWDQSEDYAFVEIDLQAYSDVVYATVLVNPSSLTEDLLGGSPDLPDLLRKTIDLQENRKFTDIEGEIR